MRDLRAGMDRAVARVVAGRDAVPVAGVADGVVEAFRHRHAARADREGRGGAARPGGRAAALRAERARHSQIAADRDRGVGLHRRARRSGMARGGRGDARGDCRYSGLGRMPSAGPAGRRRAARRARSGGAGGGEAGERAVPGAGAAGGCRCARRDRAAQDAARCAAGRIARRRRREGCGSKRRTPIRFRRCWTICSACTRRAGGRAASRACWPIRRCGHSTAMRPRRSRPRGCCGFTGCASARAVAAVYYGFAWRDRAYAYIGGFDPDMPRLSPGRADPAPRDRRGDRRGLRASSISCAAARATNTPGGPSIAGTRRGHGGDERGGERARTLPCRVSARAKYRPKSR